MTKRLMLLGRGALAALLGALLLAACAQPLPTAEEIVSRMEAARDTTQDVHAVLAIDFTSPEQSGRLVVEGWVEKTGALDAAGHPVTRVRAEVLEASEADLVGTLAVSDGERFWLYSPAANSVVVGSADEMRAEPPTSAAGSATMLQDLLQQGLDAVDLTVEGQETVAGKPTWRVAVAPKAETSAQLQLDALIQGTMWVDSELALPLKLALDAADFGAGTAEVQSIEVNAGIDDALFSFTPPAGAEVIDAAELAAARSAAQPQAATLDEARAGVSFTLREPGYLPAGLALVEVRVVGTTTAILNYGGGGASLSLVQSNADVGRDREPPAGSAVQPVTVRGVAGTLVSGADGAGSLLSWQEGGIRYIVAGTISADEALAVAEGLE